MVKKLLLLLVFLLTYIASAQTTFDASSQLAVLVPNDTGTGTILNQLASINSSGNAVNAATTDTNVPVFVVIGGAGTSGNAKLASPGSSVQCKFDAAGGAVKHFVVESTATGGRCMDAGATLPTVGWVVGQLQSSPAANSNGLVILSSSNGALPAGTADGKIPIWNNSTKQYEALDPLMQGVQAAGSTTQPNPLVCGGWDYTNGVVRSCAVDPTSKALLALVLQEPLLNTATCSDCTAGTPTKGDVITPDTNSKWARLAQTLGSAFLNVNQTTLAVPSAPTLTAANGDGTYAQNTVVFVRITFVGPSTVCATSPCETTGSTETSITLSAGNGCTTNCSAHVPIPSLVGNATGVSVYAWSVAGAERQVSGCVNLASGTCIVGSNPTFFGGTIPPLYNTAYSGTAVIPGYGGTSGTVSTSSAPIIITQKSPTIFDWVTVNGNSVATLPDRLGGVGCFWRGRQSGATTNVAEAMFECGAGTGSFIAYAYRTGATDTTYATMSDGGTNAGTGQNGIFSIGEVDATLLGPFHFMSHRLSGSDLGARINTALALQACIDPGCLIDSSNDIATGANPAIGTTITINDPVDIIFPNGTILCTATPCIQINIGGSGTHIYGLEIERSMIQTNSATGDIINNNGATNIEVDHLTLSSSVTRTAGAGIHNKGSGYYHDMIIKPVWNGIQISDDLSSAIIENIKENSLGVQNYTVGVGTWNCGILLGGMNTGSVANVRMMVIDIAGDKAFTTGGLCLDGGVDSPSCYNCQIVRNSVDFQPVIIRNTSSNIDPHGLVWNGNSDAEGGVTFNDYEITAGRGLFFQNASAASGLNGWHINGATVVGVHIDNSTCVNNQNSCVKLDNGKDVRVTNSQIYDNCVATNATFSSFLVAAGVSDFGWINNDSTTKLSAANKCLDIVHINAGASDNYTVKDNEFGTFTAAAAVSDGGTGLNKVIKDNFPATAGSNPSNSNGVSFAKATAVTVNTNVTTDQNLMSYSLRAGALNAADKVLHVTGSGIYTTVTSTPTVTLKVKLCTVSGCGSGTVITACSWTSAATTAGVTNSWYVRNCDIGVISNGASGTVIGKGEADIQIGATLGVRAPEVDDETNNAASAAIDLTAALFVQVSITFSVNQASPHTGKQWIGISQIVN